MKSAILAGTNALVLCMSSGALGGGITQITDANSFATFDTNNPGLQNGMNRWVVDGVDQLFNQWFWYRIGDAVPGNPERRFNSINLAQGPAGLFDTNLDGNPDTFTINYSHTLFNAQMSFRLQGGSLGSHTSDIGEQIRIVNTSGTVLPFHFFQYCNFNLNGTIPDTFVSVVNANAVQQNDGPFTTSETVVTPAPSHHEVGIFPATLAKLDDANGDNLNDVSTLSDPNGQDYTWAFQWDVNIAPGGALLISKDKRIGFVPSPGAISLLGLAALTTTRRRRR